MPVSRRGTRRTGALTRASVRRGSGPRGTADEEPPGRMRYLTSPTAWLVGIVLTVVTVTFQDVLTASVKTVLPLDRVPDRLSPQNAIDVVEVRDVKDTGFYVARDDPDGRLRDALADGASWRQGRRVVDAGNADWMITLQGRAAQQVRITDIVPELEGGSCAKPLGGDLVHIPAQGVADVIPLEVAMDSPRPRLTVSGKDGKAGPFFTGPKAKHITLNQNETEAFIVHATSRKGYCRWRFRVYYEVGGGTARMTISGPGGKPFEVTGELRDKAGYRNVYFPPLACDVGGSPMKSVWYEQTGAEYARDRRDDEVPPCPKS